eukprot:Hpha_TRINITY_DN15735_c5_g3::TRINITY_DN15735_c5_g3_i1::g.41967::m.41967
MPPQDADLAAMQEELRQLERMERQEFADRYPVGRSPELVASILKYLPAKELERASQVTVVWAEAAAAQGVFDAPWKSRLRGGDQIVDIRERVERKARTEGWGSLRDLHIAKCIERCAPAPLPTGVLAGKAESGNDEAMWWYVRGVAEADTEWVSDLDSPHDHTVWKRLLECEHPGLEGLLQCATLRRASGGVATRVWYNTLTHTHPLCSWEFRRAPAATAARSPAF